jgi:hypothetical protein
MSVDMSTQKEKKKEKDVEGEALKYTAAAGWHGRIVASSRRAASLFRFFASRPWSESIPP